VFVPSREARLGHLRCRFGEAVAADRDDHVDHQCCSNGLDVYLRAEVPLEQHLGSTSMDAIACHGCPKMDLNRSAAVYDLLTDGAYFLGLKEWTQLVDSAFHNLGLAVMPQVERTVTAGTSRAIRAKS